MKTSIRQLKMLMATEILLDELHEKQRIELLQNQIDAIQQSNKENIEFNKKYKNFKLCD